MTTARKEVMGYGYALGHIELGYSAVVAVIVGVLLCGGVGLENTKSIGGIID
jgi:hypothetical protein